MKHTSLVTHPGELKSQRYVGTVHEVENLTHEIGFRIAVNSEVIRILLH